MNLRKTLVTGLAFTAILLGGCAKSVDYDTFHAAAVKASETTHEFTKASVKYVDKTDSSNVEKTATLKYGADLSIITLNVWYADEGDSGVGSAAATLANSKVSAVGNKEGYEYYTVGKGFKYVAGDSTYEYEEHGLLTKAYNATKTYTITYSK